MQLSNFKLTSITSSHMQCDVLTEIWIRNYLGNEGTVNLLQDIIHLLQFGRDEGTVGSTDVTDVVEAKVVEDQNVPVIPLESAVQVAGHIVVNLHGQMMHKKRYTLTDAQDFNGEPIKIDIIQNRPWEQTETELKGALSKALTGCDDCLIIIRQIF